MLSIIGIIGNSFSLVILVKGDGKRQERPMQQFALTGLTGLSVSDLLFSIAMLPQSFIGGHKCYDDVGFELIFNTYQFAIVNTFILSSTLITLLLALGRYLVVTMTFQMMNVIRPTLARWGILIAFLLSLVANLPRFWFYEQKRVLMCDAENVTTFKYYTDHRVEAKNCLPCLLYFFAYFLLFILTPFAALLFCNIRLINELRVPTLLSHQVNQQLRMRQSDFRRLTVCLLCVVACFLLLVIPGEILVFIIEALKYHDLADLHSKTLLRAMSILSVMQSLNFAFNFLFYCYIIKIWRRAVAYVFCCGCAKRGRHHGSSFQFSRSGMTQNSRTTTLNATSVRMLTSQMSQEQASGRNTGDGIEEI